MSAPVFQTEAHALTDTTATSLTISKPSGVASGDFLLAVYFVQGVQGITLPSGWTNKASQHDVFDGGVLYIDYLVAGGSEPASYQWSWTGSQHAGGAIYRITGQNTTTPFDVAPTTAGPASAVTRTAPDLTTVTNDCWVGRFNGGTRIADAPFTSPGTEILDIAGTNAFDSISCATGWANKATAGAVGTADFTASQSGFSALATVAIAPAAGGTAPTLAQLMRGTGRSMTRGFNKRAG